MVSAEDYNQIWDLYAMLSVQNGFEKRRPKAGNQLGYCWYSLPERGRWPKQDSGSTDRGKKGEGDRGGEEERNEYVHCVLRR